MKTNKLVKLFFSMLILSTIATFLALAIFDQAYASSWRGPVQISHYTLAENGSVTASGIRMTNSSMGVAVPMGKVVRKSTWKKSSSYFKRTHFYYGEKLVLKHGERKCTVRVVDCGGFGGYGGYYKGCWRQRLFDLQPAVKRKLRCGDVSYISWKIA